MDDVGLRGSAVVVERGALAIRPLASLADIEGAIAVLRATHTQAGTLSDRFQPDGLRTRMRFAFGLGRREDPTFLVARGAGWQEPVVGVVALSPAFCSAAGWELGYLAVDPAQQGLGLGRRLVDEALAFVLAQRPAPSFVLARAARPALFERIGFRRIDANGASPALVLLSL